MKYTIYIINFFKYLSLSLLIVTSHLACDNNKEATTPRPAVPPPFYGGGGPNMNNCVNCFSGPVKLMGGLQSQVNNSVFLAVDVYASQPLMSQAQLQNGNPLNPSYYNGPATILGTLRVSSTDPYQMCNAAPGDYYIQPLTQGMMSNLMIGGNIKLQAISQAGYIINIVLTGTSFISMPNTLMDPASGRISLDLYMESVNNIPCGRTLYTY